MSEAGSPSLTLRSADEAFLRTAAEAAYPRECCGLLVGRSFHAQATDAWLVTRVIPTDNLHADPLRGFEVDPTAQFAVLRQLRDGPGGSSSERLLGHYHSHPDAPAVPSARDLAQINDPELIWLILGVAKSKAQGPTAWQASTDPPAFHPLRLIIVQAGAPGTEMP